MRQQALTRREELEALRAKASRHVTMREAAKTAVPVAVEAVRKDVAPALEELASRLSSVERAQVEAAKTAAKTARDSGAVAGMLARDLAAARVDAREGIASVRDEFRTTADAAKGELRKEMTMLWELVESVEKDTAGLRRPMEALAEEIKDAVEGVVRDRDDDETASSSASTMMATLSSEQLAELRAAVADTTSARVREAVEQLLGSINAVTSEETIVRSLATKLDDAQWEAVVSRLDAIDEGVRTSSERVVEDDLEDLRLEIRREISRDMGRVVESVEALKLALEEAQATSSEASARGEGSTEAAAAVKQWAEEKLKAAETPREVEEQIQWHAAVVDAEDEDEQEKELVWVGETTTDEPKKKAMNEGVSREEAFANMQQFNEVFGSMLEVGREANSNLPGPLALNEWMKSSQAGTFLRVLGVGDGKKASTVASTLNKVTDAGFVVGNKLVQTQSSGSVGKLGDNPHATIASGQSTNAESLGKTHFLGCFMKDTTGSSFLKDSGIQVEDAVIAGAVLWAMYALFFSLEIDEYLFGDINTKQFPKNKDRFEFTLINEKEVGVSFERKF